MWWWGKRFWPQNVSSNNLDVHKGIPNISSIVLFPFPRPYKVVHFRRSISNNFQNTFKKQAYNLSTFDNHKTYGNLSNYKRLRINFLTVVIYNLGAIYQGHFINDNESSVNKENVYLNCIILLYIFYVFSNYLHYKLNYSKNKRTELPLCIHHK